ncbi:Hypothetical_protein [Hexamita inflata]|uniref:Hypothetical_protein n=1 Tax=Hexamita inflata TaxID=28002 RepID=A0AA86VD08_9EUKA|nr:Hypothetical protein HINF_LOCUS50838 [Hexamita inflata]
MQVLKRSLMEFQLFSWIICLMLFRIASNALHAVVKKKNISKKALEQSSYGFTILFCPINPNLKNQLVHYQVHKTGQAFEKLIKIVSNFIKNQRKVVISQAESYWKLF